MGKWMVSLVNFHTNAFSKRRICARLTSDLPSTRLQDGPNKQLFGVRKNIPHRYSRYLCIPDLMAGETARLGPAASSDCNSTWKPENPERANRRGSTQSLDGPMDKFRGMLRGLVTFRLTGVFRRTARANSTQGAAHRDAQPTCTPSPSVDDGVSQRRSASRWNVVRASLGENVLVEHDPGAQLHAEERKVARLKEKNGDGRWAMVQTLVLDGRAAGARRARKGRKALQNARSPAPTPSPTIGQSPSAELCALEPADDSSAHQSVEGAASQSTRDLLSVVWPLAKDAGHNQTLADRFVARQGSNRDPARQRRLLSQSSTSSLEELRGPCVQRLSASPAGAACAGDREEGAASPVRRSLKLPLCPLPSLSGGEQRRPPPLGAVISIGEQFQGRARTALRPLPTAVRCNSR